MHIYLCTYIPLISKYHLDHKYESFLLLEYLRQNGLSKPMMNFLIEGIMTVKGIDTCGQDDTLKSVVEGKIYDACEEMEKMIVDKIIQKMYLSIYLNVCICIYVNMYSSLFK
jgi:hypothetical protein